MGVYKPFAREYFSEEFFDLCEKEVMCRFAYIEKMISNCKIYKYMENQCKGCPIKIECETIYVKLHGIESDLSDALNKIEKFRKDDIYKFKYATKMELIGNYLDLAEKYKILYEEYKKVTEESIKKMH